VDRKFNDSLLWWSQDTHLVQFADPATKNHCLQEPGPQSFTLENGELRFLTGGTEHWLKFSLETRSMEKTLELLLFFHAEHNLPTKAFWARNLSSFKKSTCSKAKWTAKSDPSVIIIVLLFMTCHESSFLHLICTIRYIPQKLVSCTRCWEASLGKEI
jgi:hypothetical protein